MQSISLIILQNQLRLQGNPLFQLASKYEYPILPVWVAPNWDEMHEWTSFSRIGRIRAKFLWESFIALRKELNLYAGDISIFSQSELDGSRGNFWHELFEEYLPKQIFIADEPGYYENSFLESIYITGEKYKIPVKSIDCNGLFREEDLEGRWDILPEVFTDFRKKLEWNRDFPVRQDINSENPSALFLTGYVSWEPNSCKKLESEFKDYVENYELIAVKHKVKIPIEALEFRGGEKEILTRLQEYFWNKDLLRIYKETRNGMIGWDYSSKFSPWLANGCISPVTIYNEILRYESERISNESTYWLKFELLWREFFRWIVRKSRKNVFAYSGIRSRTPIGLEQNWEKFESWRKGETGDEFVDANMRELLYTGFMSNRGRQNVASYLVHDMNVDWRLGAEWFETQLIDYDVSSNWGNWNYIAGVGNDPRNRKFNTLKQAQDYDPKGEYRNLWT